MPNEWEIVRQALRDAGVEGTEDLGRFVNNPTYFRPSRLDEAAAAPVFLRLLPTLVLEAYRKWGHPPGETGWVLGDTLARKADKSRADDFIQLATEERYGLSSAFIVDALWRFKSIRDVDDVLRMLIRDPTVSLYAMSALQRTIGAEQMAIVLRELLAEDPDDPIAGNARQQFKRVERKLRNAR